MFTLINNLFKLIKPIKPQPIYEYKWLKRVGNTTVPFKSGNKHYFTEF